MLDQIIENIIQKIRNEVVQPGMKDIPLTYIFTRDIPDSIKHFFDQEVELWIREEAEKFSANGRFDYEMPEVQMLIDKIFDTLKQTATFHINQFNRLLERAIKLEANYLIRPQQTLSQFLFKDSQMITTIEVYDMLKYFDKFQYYKDALTDYFNLKYLREISQTQFQELIAAIDRQVYSQKPIEKALQTIKTVTGFINEGRPESTDALSARILYMIFKDRHLDEFAAYLEREIKANVDTISLAQLEQILRTGKTVSEIEAAHSADLIAVENIFDIEKEKPQVSVDIIEVPKATEPPLIEDIEEEYEEEYEEELEQEPEALETPSPVKAPVEPVDSKRTRTSAVEQLADLVGEKMKGDRLESLANIVTSRQRKRFVKKIFKKREAAYEEFVNLLNNTPTWKHASNLIDTFFYQQGLNPYSKEALEFSDLVYNRYYPKDIAIKKSGDF